MCLCTTQTAVPTVVRRLSLGDDDRGGDDPESTLAPAADSRVQETAAAVGVGSRVEGTGEHDTSLLTQAQKPLWARNSHQLTEGAEHLCCLPFFNSSSPSLCSGSSETALNYNLFAVAYQLFRIEVRTGKR